MTNDRFVASDSGSEIPQWVANSRQSLTDPSSNSDIDIFC